MTRLLSLYTLYTYGLHSRVVASGHLKMLEVNKASSSVSGLLKDHVYTCSAALSS